MQFQFAFCFLASLNAQIWLRNGEAGYVQVPWSMVSEWCGSDRHVSVRCGPARSGIGSAQRGSVWKGTASQGKVGSAFVMSGEVE